MNSYEMSHDKKGLLGVAAGIPMLDSRPSTEEEGFMTVRASQPARHAPLLLRTPPTINRRYAFPETLFHSNQISQTRLGSPSAILGYSARALQRKERVGKTFEKVQNLWSGKRKINW